MAIRLLLALVFVCALAPAQQQVDPFNRYERIMAIVPMTGVGTHDDPARPMYAPAPAAINPGAGAGILAFNFVVSDDGKFALVEYVARDRASFQQILADTSIIVFLKGRDKRADAKAAFQKLKKNFDFTMFGAILP